MNETTENFWQVWNSLEPWQPPVVFWRLYYDELGLPMFYSQEDVPGNYIDVTPEQYRRSSMNVRVRAGRLIELDSAVIKKKIPAATGTPCCPTDVSIVVHESTVHQCWRYGINETN